MTKINNDIKNLPWAFLHFFTSETLKLISRLIIEGLNLLKNKILGNNSIYCNM